MDQSKLESHLWSTQFPVYSFGPAMLTNLELEVPDHHG